MRYRPGVRVWIVRAIVLAGVSLLGYLLHLVLAPRGLGWIVWALGALVLAFFALELALRARRRAGHEGDEERWRASLEDPAARRAAVRELHARIERARRLGPRLRVEHARLATILAELLTADAKPERAIAALAKVPLDQLTPIEAAVVRHARAQAYLAAGDLDGADVALAPLAERAGDDVLDAALALARAALALGRGALEEAERAARAVSEAHDDEELRGEATALLAACASARGDAEGARALAAAVPPEQRRRLALLGPASVRAVLAP